MRKSNLLQPEISFLLLGILFGLAFIFITPPFQVSDEPCHFFRSYGLSEFKLFAEKSENTVGSYMPSSLMSVSYDLFGKVRFDSTKKLSANDLSNAFKLDLNPYNRIFIAYPNTALYSPVPYIPQVVGIIAGKILKLKPIILMYLGRLFNLAFFIITTFYAIRTLPVGKTVLFLIALMPMTLFQAASLSADCVLNSVCFLFVAKILQLAFSKEVKEVKLYSLLFLAILSVAISLSKQPYVFISLLLFLIPASKFKNKRAYLSTFLGIIGASIFTSFLWSLIVKGLYVPLLPYVNPSEQVKYIFSHPFNFAYSILDAAFNRIDGRFRQVIGYLGWTDTKLNNFIYYSYLLVLSYVALIDSDDDTSITNFHKLLIFVIISIIFVIISLSIYLSWSSVGSKTIDGIQGRYFIPLIFPLMTILYNNKIRKLIDSNFARVTYKVAIFVPVYSLVVLVWTVIILFQRYYVTN